MGLFRRKNENKMIAQKELVQIEALYDERAMLIANLRTLGVDDDLRKKTEESIKQLTDTIASMERTQSVKKESKATRAEKAVGFVKAAALIGLCGFELKSAWTKDHTTDYLPNRETGKVGTSMLGRIFNKLF